MSSALVLTSPLRSPSWPETVAAHIAIGLRLRGHSVGVADIADIADAALTSALGAVDGMVLLAADGGVEDRFLPRIRRLPPRTLAGIRVLPVSVGAQGHACVVDRVLRDVLVELDAVHVMPVLFAPEQDLSSTDPEHEPSPPGMGLAIEAFAESLAITRQVARRL